MATIWISFILYSIVVSERIQVFDIARDDWIIPFMCWKKNDSKQKSLFEYDPPSKYKSHYIMLIRGQRSITNIIRAHRCLSQYRNYHNTLKY